MRVRNPFHVTEAEQFAEQNKAAIDTYLENKGGYEVDFDTIRSDHPDLADRLTDGMLKEIFQRLGYEVTR